MSYTTLFIIKPDGEFKAAATFGNAHRSAMLVWLELAKKYGIADATTMLFDEKKAGEIWNIGRRADVEECDRITMLTTFDAMVVKKQHLKKVVDAMRECAQKSLPDHSSISQQADEIEKLLDDNIFGIAWNQTSVCSSWDGYYDANTESYNLNNAKTHRIMFEEVHDK
jgi:hypothetical protein